MSLGKNEMIILIYKKDKNDNYFFDSIEIIYRSENYYFEPTTGKFKGKKLPIEVSTFVSHNSSLLFESCEAKLSNANLEYPFEKYVYYDIADKIYDAIKSVVKDKSGTRIFEVLCELGRTTQFIKEKDNMFSVVHTTPLKYQEQIENIKKVLKEQENNTLYQIEKYITEVGQNGSGVVGDHDITHISQSPEPVKKFDENGEPSQVTLENPIFKTNINQIISDIKGKIVGQDEAIEAVVANIYANQRIIETGNKDLIATQKTSILLDGPTGTGKTAIVKEVADKLKLPMVVTTSTTYSTTGYVGSTITDILSKLYEKANGDLELAQKGIVVIDEIDKLGGFSKEKELSMRKGVQQELLSFISGAKYNIQIGGQMGTTVEFDTSNLTFIGLGAFTSIRDQKIEENKAKNKITIGFMNSSEEIEKEESKIENKTYQIEPQDYIEYGLERELVGRFALLTSTRAYSIEDYRRILLESTISPLKTFIEFVKSFGIEAVNYDDEFVDKVCEMAYEANFGARGLHQIISNLKNVLLLDIISSQSKTLILTTEMLDRAKEKNVRTY